MDFHEGVVVAGRFRLVRMVGAGGMGEVWEADDAQAGRRVALKRLLPAAAQHHEVVLRFRREALILGRLGSEHVARVIDFIEDESFGLVLVMEFIEGPSLAQVLEERSLSIEEAIDLAHDLVKALVDLHEAKIVHRDLKPGNIILRPAHGDRFRAIIVDFGISRVLPGGSENEVTGITRANIALGTVEYMAPEQILNSRDVTPITDLYAVGVILFRAVKGQHAFGNRRGEELARAKLMEEAPPLDPGRDDEIAEGLVRIVARALKKRPSQRFPSARDMLAELDALKSLADQVSDLDDTTTDGASTVVRRSPVEPPPSGKFPSRPPVRPAAGAPAAPRSPSSTQTVAARPVPEPPPTRATAAPDPRLSRPEPIDPRPPQASLPEVAAPPSARLASSPEGSGENAPVSVRRPDEGRNSLPGVAAALPPGPLARAATEPEAPGGMGRAMVALIALTTLAVGIAIGLVIAPGAPAPAASACPSASAPVAVASALAPAAQPSMEAIASAAPAATEEPEIDDMEIVSAQPAVAVAPKPTTTPKPVDTSTRPSAPSSAPTGTGASTATAPTSTGASTSAPAGTGTAGPPATSTATATGTPASTATAPTPAPAPSPAPVAPIDSTL